MVLRIVPPPAFHEREMTFTEMFDMAERELERSRRYVVWYRIDAGTGSFRTFLKASDGGPRRHTLREARRAVIRLQELGAFAWMKKREVP